MNKKGFQLLSEETLKIVIAVICLVFLVYILVSLYFSVTGAQDQKYAQENINGERGLAQQITTVNQNGTSEEQYIPNPTGWHIFGFVGQTKKPNICTDKNCICLCRKIAVDPFGMFNRQIIECDGKGACVIVLNLNDVKEINIENTGTTLLIQKINGMIEITKNGS